MCRFPKSTKDGQRAGQDLAGGFYGILLQLCGDLDYNCKWLALPRWSAAERMCCLCKASLNGPLSWRNNRSDAAWISSCLNPDSWRVHYPNVSCIFNLTGLSGINVALDYMHCMYLGWLQSLYGSVLYLLVHHVMDGSPIECLASIAHFIKNFQAKHDSKHRYRHRLSKLTMIKPKKGYPKLRGRAADIMGLGAAILSLWTEKSSPDDVAHRMIKVLLSLNVDIAHVLDSFSPRYGFFNVPEPQASKLFETGLTMAQLHSQLFERYKLVGIKIFNQTSKTHFVLHSLQLARHLHPFLVWCYKGETMMHKSQRLWKSCLDGTKHYNVSNKAAVKYMYALHARFQSN